jgi:hypothetical protein
MREGYGIIAGRSAKNARAALDAADAAGVDQRLVEAVDGGYEVPLAVLDAYEKATLGKTGKHDPEAVKAEQDTTGEDTSDTNEPAPEEPPRAGAGSGVDAWSEWAKETHGYDPAEGLSRKELIERYGE